MPIRAPVCSQLRIHAPDRRARVVAPIRLFTTYRVPGSTTFRLESFFFPLLSFSSVHRAFYTRLFIPVFRPFALTVELDVSGPSPQWPTVIERFLVGLLAFMEEASESPCARNFVFFCGIPGNIQSPRFPLNRFPPNLSQFNGLHRQDCFEGFGILFFFCLEAEFRLLEFH